jgi:hypothetical protein
LCRFTGEGSDQQECLDLRQLGLKPQPRAEIIMNPILPSRSVNPPRSGPMMIVPALWASGENSGRPLTAEEQALLAVISTVVRFKKGHAVLLSEQRALGKVGLFLQMLETHQAARGESTGEVYLQMTRRDIASYAGITPEAVTRSLQDLVGRGAIAFRDRRHVQIVNRARLAAAVFRKTRITR